MDNQPEDLLQQCQRHFPGLAWEILTGWAVGSAGPFSVELQCRQDDVTAICKIHWGEQGPRRWMDQTTILTSDRFPDEPLTNEQALAQAAERWREFVEQATGILAIKYQPKGSGRIRRSIEEAMQDV